MDEFVLSTNGIINQIQYYGSEYIHYHIVDSIFTIIVGMVFLLITTGLLWLAFKYRYSYKNTDGENYIGMISFAASMITGMVSMVSLIIGWYNYTIWRQVPVGAAIQQILDMGR